MKNLRRAILALSVFAVAAGAAPVGAQVYITRTVAPRGWLGISYEEKGLSRNGDFTSSVVILSVTKDSPAERAGVQAGDTVVRINDLRASTELFGSLGASVEPGDTVRLVVRRGSKDHTLAIEVAKRPPQMYMQARRGDPQFFTFDPDSVRGMMRIFVDSMYAGLDTSRTRLFRAEGMPARGGVFFRDSLRTYMPLMTDSLRHYLPMMSDSMMKAMPRIDMRADMPAGLFEFEGHTPDVVFRSIARSENAFAGADLADVNEGLSEYFGAKSGVLVIRVPKGTPA